MGVVLGGMAIMGGISAFMGAQGASAEAAAARLQFEEQEFQRQWQNQVENRNIAKTNAAKWMNSRKIAEWANINRAEKEFWSLFNFDNSTGSFGKDTKILTDQLLARTSAKNINQKSGTAQAILRSATEKSTRVATHERIRYGVGLEVIKREQQQTLASRDFSFNEHIPFMPGSYGGPSASAAFNMALIGGLAQTGAGVLGAYYQGEIA
jgi:hypothetical protein